MIFIYINLFSIAANLHEKLKDAGILFNQFGYPILPPDSILNEIPEEIIPFEHRYECKDPNKTVLCHFVNDELLYTRLKFLDDDIEKLNGYMGVTGFDLSPRQGYDIHLQKFNIYLSQMVNAYRAMNGIKILPNFRTGDLSTLDCLNSYPPKSTFAVGTLGCARGNVEANKLLLKAKILCARPKRFLIYGTLKDCYAEILNDYGIPYRVYENHQKVSRRKYKEAI